MDSCWNVLGPKGSTNWNSLHVYIAHKPQGYSLKSRSLNLKSDLVTTFYIRTLSLEFKLVAKETTHWKYNLSAENTFGRNRYNWPRVNLKFYKCPLVVSGSIGCKCSHPHWRMWYNFTTRCRSFALRLCTHTLAIRISSTSNSLRTMSSVEASVIKLLLLTHIMLWLCMWQSCRCHC